MGNILQVTYGYVTHTVGEQPTSGIVNDLLLAMRTEPIGARSYLSLARLLLVPTSVWHVIPLLILDLATRQQILKEEISFSFLRSRFSRLNFLII